jgi:hypothetical protein
MNDKTPAEMTTEELIAEMETSDYRHAHKNLVWGEVKRRMLTTERRIKSIEEFTDQALVELRDAGYGHGV